METIKKNGVKYSVFTSLIEGSREKKDIYMSEQNKGKFVKNRETGKSEKLNIAFEGLKFYHLGGTASPPCKMVLKTEFELSLN